MRLSEVATLKKGDRIFVDPGRVSSWAVQHWGTVDHVAKRGLVFYVEDGKSAVSQCKPIAIVDFKYKDLA